MAWLWRENRLSLESSYGLLASPRQPSGVQELSTFPSVSWLAGWSVTQRHT